jgi:hypothetical protein
VQSFSRQMFEQSLGKYIHRISLKDIAKGIGGFALDSRLERSIES